MQRDVVEFVGDVEWADFGDRVRPPERDAILDLAVRLAYRVPGNIVEMGVADGGSTRVLRRTMWREELVRAWRPRKKLFACDSFEGLTERFENALPGEFACEPPRIRGVNIVKGYFEDSLTPALASRVGTVALASLDADLYSSTLCALRWLTPLLRTGSVLVFDEYIGEEESEKRAHVEWMEETGVSTVLLAHFLRDPSGYGTKPDRRCLYQVIAAEPFLDAPKPIATTSRRMVEAVRRRWPRQAK